MTTRASHVLFVLGNGGRGGMQSQVRLVAAGLSASGTNVTIAVGGGGVEPVAGVRVVTLPELSPRWPLPFLVALRATCRDLEVDIVHGHGLRLAPLVALTFARRRLVTCHGLDPRAARVTLAIARLAPVEVISCGEGPRRVLAAHHVSSTVINNAIASIDRPVAPADLRQQLGLLEGVPLIVYPARFSEQKGHDRLVGAMALVRAQLGARAPEVVCVGDGPLFESIRTSAQVTGERPLVHCVSYSDGASAWLAASDFFVLSSRWEGQPQVVLEALACDLPVLTCTPTGVEDLIYDGRNGRVVTSVSDMAREIVTWTTSPTERPRDAGLNREILSSHTLDAVLASYREHYERA